MGENVRKAGSDVQKGTIILSRGRVLTAGDVNALAAQGRSLIAVVRMPKVYIVSSGSELCPVDGGTPKIGQVVNSNVIALAAAVRVTGAQAVMLPIIRDDLAETRARLKEASNGDMIICSGGMSVGDYDFVRQVLQELTGDGFVFWKVAVKPGKPLGFGYVDRCAIFGLPGNPASSWVTYALFVLPALRKMMGH